MGEIDGNDVPEDEDGADFGCDGLDKLTTLRGRLITLIFPPEDLDENNLELSVEIGTGMTYTFLSPKIVFSI
jgi:hypothetical protein